MTTAVKPALDDEQAQTSPDTEAVISVRQLKKSFGSKEVLRDVSLDLRRGESLAIIGKSGQGKSVTIKCIIGLLQPDGGKVQVLGKDPIALHPQELKQLQMRVGFLFQGGALYDSMPVRENLAFPLTRVLRLSKRSEIDERINDVLEGVGLKDVINKMPSELSGGQRKRIALARTLIMKPEIMLYDEPTTGLDPITSKEISELIVTVQQKYEASSIIITHDMACARITTNRMLVLDEGRFVAEGTFNNLQQSDNPLVRSFFE